jgi:hypothetical protein
MYLAGVHLIGMCRSGFQIFQFGFLGEIPVTHLGYVKGERILTIILHQGFLSYSCGLGLIAMTMYNPS